MPRGRFAASRSTARSIRCSIRRAGALVRRDARRLRVRRQGAALRHPHEAAARDRGAGGQLLRLGRAAARRASSGRCCGSSRRTSRSSRRRSSLSSHPAIRHRAGPRACPRHDHRVRRTVLARDRCGAADAPCGRSAPSELRRSGLRRLLRQYNVAFVVADTAGAGPRRTTSPPTSSTCGCTVADAVPERVHRCRARPLGRAASRPGEWRAGRPMRG